MNKKTISVLTGAVIALGIVSGAVSPVLAENAFTWILEPNPVYQTIYFPNLEDRWIVSDESGLYGVIDNGGNTVLPLEYSSLYYHSDKFIEAVKDGKTGAIDEKGNVIVPFDEGEVYITYYSDAFIRVSKNSVYKVIDEKGNTVSAMGGYEWPNYVSDSFISVEKGNKYGAMDIDGNVVIPFEYDGYFLNDVDQHIILTAKDGMYGAIDFNGKVIIPFEYDRYLSYFSDDFIEAEKDGRLGAIDINGNTVLPFEYEGYFNYFSDNFIAMQKDGKYGAIDLSGNTVLPFEYDWLEYYSDSCIIAGKNRKDGVIDISGNIVLPFEYDFLTGYTGVFIKAEKDGREGIFDMEANPVIPVEYEHFDYDNSALGYIRLNKDGKWGVIDIRGNVVLPFEYELVSDAPDGQTFGVKTDAGCGILKVDKEACVAGNSKQIVLEIGNRNASVWGKDAKNDVAPVIRNDRTMLPIRFIAEALGADVLWDEEEQLVTVTRGETVIKITIGQNTAVVNGAETELDSPAFIESGRTFLPLRFVSENLGAKVKWNGKHKHIIITK